MNKHTIYVDKSFVRRSLRHLKLTKVPTKAGSTSSEGEPMKSLVLFCLFLGCLTLIYADVQVGSGTVTTQSPFNHNYHFTRNVSLYGAAEIGTPMILNQLRWRLLTEGSYGAYVRIYLKHTTRTYLTSYYWPEISSGMTKVFESWVVFSADTWISFIINAFTYNGTDNLAIITETNPYYTSIYPTFQASASAANAMAMEASGFYEYPTSGFTPTGSRPNIILSGQPVLTPYPAKYPNPIDGMNSVAVNGTLSWTFGFNTTSYDLWLGPAGAMTQVVTGAAVGGATGSYTYANLAYSTTYQWKVVSYNSSLESVVGPIWSFGTRIPPGQVGNGTMISGYPFNAEYAFTRTVTLYLGSEIGLTGYLERLEWQVSQPYYTNIHYKIWAKATTFSSIGSVGSWNSFIPTATFLLEGDRAFSSAGWTAFPLNTPFTYGSGNLIIAVEAYYTAPMMGTPRFFYTPTMDPRSQLMYGSSPNNLSYLLASMMPNIRMQIQPFGTVAPILDYPATASTEMPRSGFSFAWNPSYDANQTQYFKLYISNSADQTEFFANAVSYVVNGNSCNPGLDSSNPLTYAHGDHKYWTVAACANGLAEHYTWPPRDFTIEPYYTEMTFPRTQDFQSWPPENWSLAGGTYNFESFLDDNGGLWAQANSLRSLSNATFQLTTPAYISSQQLNLGFNWSHAYVSYLPDNSFAVQISADLSTWTELWTLSGTAFDSNDGATDRAPGYGAYKQIAIPSQYTGSRFWLRFKLLTSGGGKMFLDDFSLFPTNALDASVRNITGLPDSQQLGQSYTPYVRVENRSSMPLSFIARLAIESFYVEAHWVSELAAGTSINVAFSAWTPTLPGPYHASATVILENDGVVGNNGSYRDFRVWDSVWQVQNNSYILAYDGSAAGYTDASGHEYVVAGGGFTLGYTPTVGKYDVRGGYWIPLTSLPDAKSQHASAVVGDYYYVIGGTGYENYMSSVYRLNLVSGGAWEQMQSLPVGIKDCRAVSYQNRYIYLAGGENGISGFVNSVYIYDTISNSWATASSLPVLASSGAFAITGNTLVYVGGFIAGTLSGGVYVGQIDPNDPAVISWGTQRGENPFRTEADITSSQTQNGPEGDDRLYPAGILYNLAGASWGNGSVLITGGYPQGIPVAPVPTKVYAYRPADNSWTPLPTLPNPAGSPLVGTVEMENGDWTAVVASGLSPWGTLNFFSQILTTQAIPALSTPVVSISHSNTMMLLTWQYIPGALNGYRVESSSSPDGPWIQLGVTPYNNFMTATENRCFFRVTALN